MGNRSIKILAIDDNKDNLVSINALIKETFPEVEVILASSGEQGIALAATNDPHVILLDIVMPGMDGFEVCRKLKSDTSLKDIPVIFVTAIKGDKDSRIIALESGAEAFLSKPIDISELTAQIRAMVKLKTAIVEKRDENERLTSLVAQRTMELDRELVERKRVEDDLRKSEIQYRLVAHTANDAIVTADITGKIIAWNLGAERIFGYTEMDIVGKDLIYLMPETYRDMHKKGLRQLELGSNPRLIGKTVELLGLHKEGHEFPIELSLAEWSSSDGKFVTGIIRDISIRKKAEKDLKESEALYRNLVEVLPDGVYKSTEEGRFVDVNPAMFKMLGYESKEELMAIDIKTQMYFQVSDRESVILQENNQEIGVYKLKKKDGTALWVEDHGWLNFDERNGILYHEGIVRDITERRIAEDKITMLAHAIRSIGECVSITDMNDKILFVNNALLKTYQFDEHELIGNSIDIIRSSNNPSHIINEILPSTVAGGWQGELLNRRKDGSEFPVFLSTSMVKDELGVPVALIGVSNDISERKQIEKALQKSEEKHRILFMDSPDAYLISIDGVFVDCNKASEVMLRCHRNKIIGQSPAQISPEFQPDGRSSLDASKVKIKETFKSGNNTFEWVHRRFDGTDFIAEVCIATMMLDDRQALFITLRDISDRKHTEKELLKLRNAIDRSGEVVFMTDRKGVFTFINPGFTTTYGYLPEDVIGKATPHILNSGLMDGKIFETFWYNLLQGNEVKLDLKNRTKNGAIIDIEGSANAIIDLDNSIIGFLGIQRDISDRKRNEQELIEAKDQAEESDRLKSAFLANMSHEIRTPMNGILGFAELLKTPGITGDQQQEYVQIIKKSGDRMLNIINDIIDISKIESGQMKLSVSETKIKDQIEYVYTFFKPEAETKGIRLNVKIELPEGQVVVTDKEKVYAILTNLVKNAIKYTDSGFIEFGCSILNSSGSKELKFYVKDTGIGVPKDRQEAIFDRFIQADIGDTRAFQGAGLGLAISKAYVEMLGGKMWVESEVQKGSTFSFTIPIQDAPLKDLSLKNNLMTDKAKSEIRNLKVLIAEDDEASGLLITMALKMFCKEILNAKTGGEAVDICRNNPDLDLILMDIKMPIIDGHEATRMIRQFNKKVVIIAQTAYGLSGDKEKAIQAGCDDYISKPIDVAVLRDLIRKHFEK